ncbi:hypothetical protein HY798_01405 [Candidatus Falkowbacteria bacterium]|nr:hypothetical protein [Candidatus Falkowbacteria bacterium]
MSYRAYKNILYDSLTCGYSWRNLSKHRLVYEREKMPFIPEMHPEMAPVSWDHFVANMPPRSIALDGFVYDPPEFDKNGLHINFDHHKGPPRSSMLCTSSQVLVGIREGLLDLFVPTGKEEVRVWMNDCDPDVALAWFAFSHTSQMRPSVAPALHRLFGHIQEMDRASGLVDIPSDLPIVGQCAWIFDPYWRFRLSGAIDTKDGAAHMSVLEDVSGRVLEYFASRGNIRPIDDRFEELGGGSGWVLMREIGPHARMRMANRGVRAFVSARQRSDNRWVYTVCRKSQYIWWFPVPEICEYLNALEDDGDKFGGGDIIFGNARGNGSARDPKQIESAINDFLRENNLREP